MSTEHQKYSTENQSEAIAKYASQRNISIVRTYADEGKSGLNLDGRVALRRLIDDVESGRVDFQHILVYDVSRWGRFQNADESAYLEYICTRAGIKVHYCAEQFENDGSIAATVIKSMKRAMAGEYSRELSAKVFAGQCRLITLGFRQGGMAGFGLRRRLLDERGESKGELRVGEHKSLQTDRVILVPGPDEEILSVRRMYRLFVEQGATEREIAGTLNAEGIVTDLGRAWTRATVHQVLTNEKYAGDNVFNRVSFKLKQRRVRNSPDQIVRATGAFEPIVDRSLFEAARRIIAARSLRYSDDEMLVRLTNVLEQNGCLSALIIDERDDLPSSSAYRTRFGSLLRAYELIGYSPGRDYRYVEINRFLRSLYSDAVAETIASIRATGSTVSKNPITDLLTINDEITASLVVSRCLETPAGARRWKVRIDTGLQPDISVVLRMRPDNRMVQDYYLLPRVDFFGQRIRMAEENGLHLEAYRFDTLDPFFSLTSRVRIRRAA
jgi:DNA invertase Pin-like site-specific DNA recombinase